MNVIRRRGGESCRKNASCIKSGRRESRRKALRAATAAFLAIICLMASACGKKQDSAPKTLEEFNDASVTVGVVDGYIFGDAVVRDLPQAQVRHYDSRDTAYRGLLIGEVDGIADDEPIIRAILRSGDMFTLLDGYLEASDYSFIFGQNERGLRLSGEYSEYITRMKGSGQLQKLDEKWFGGDTDNKISGDAGELPNLNGKLRIAYDASNIPFAYDSAGKPTGYDIDLAIGFCREYGYSLEFCKVSFTDMLRGVQEGTYDVGCGAITITPERQQMYYFGMADYSGGISICTAGTSDRGGSADAGYRAQLRSHFRRSFLEEGRYKLFLRGIGTTLLISLLAVLQGTLFGVILYIASRRAGFVIRGIAKGVAWFLLRVPPIMVIMLVFYRFYKDLGKGGIISAVIGFTLTFGAQVYRSLEKNAAAADDGLLERDYRLEYIETPEFFRALRWYEGPETAEDYFERIIELIKGTSVVGYVAAYDLTKVFDVIRLGSYEVVAPLIVTIIAYVVIIHCVTVLMRLAVRSPWFRGRQGEKEQ